MQIVYSIFLFFPENKLWPVMQIVSSISYFFPEKKLWPVMQIVYSIFLFFPENKHWPVMQIVSSISYSSQKISFGLTCKLSPLETICMIGQSLFNVILDVQ